MSPVIRNRVAASTSVLACLDQRGQGERAVTAPRAPSRSPGLFLLALCAATAGLTTAARAEIVQIPAITFVNRVSATADVLGEASGGTLTTAAGTFYAPVPFPTDGVTVCKFTLVHRDNDDADITARLMKKKIVIGGNPFVDGVVQMARVQTVGGTSGVKRKSDITINQPVIEMTKAFYYAELTVGSNFIEVIGVQIEYGATCP